MTTDPFARKKNPALKKERGYTDPKSFVRNDGSEVLHGKDWKQRKVELWMRAQGRCEYIIPDLAEEEGTGDICARQRCSADGVIPAHIEPRHPNRDDRLSNLKLYCFRHDRLTEKQSWRRTRFGESRKGVEA